jgi:hypothetical protein
MRKRPSGNGGDIPARLTDDADLAKTVTMVGNRRLSECTPDEILANDLCIQLRSGFHVSMMTNDERAVMHKIHGDLWFAKWNYTLDDFDAINPHPSSD